MGDRPKINELITHIVTPPSPLLQFFSLSARLKYARTLQSLHNYIATAGVFN
jgi:hypothetical protein